MKKSDNTEAILAPVKRYCDKCGHEGDLQKVFSMVSVPSYTDKEGVMHTITKPMFQTWLCTSCTEDVKSGKLREFSMGTRTIKDEDLEKHYPWLVQALLSGIPPETVVYRPLDGKSDGYTAQELIVAVGKEDDERIVAWQWATDVVTISRDFLVRQSKKSDR